MANKLPQPTATIVKRLQRVAKCLDRLIANDWVGTSDEAQWRARANTCWQAAARLEELQKNADTLPERFYEEITSVK